MARRHALLLLLVAVAASLSVACTDDGVDPVTDRSTSPRLGEGPPSIRTVGPEHEPRLLPAACPDGVPRDPRVRCSWLEVRADRDGGEGPTVVLPVAVVRARAERAADETVVYLAGGPGDAGLEAVDGFLAEAHVGPRDVVLFDQRGAGSSVPSLDCPEVAEALIGTFTTADGPTTEGARVATGFRRCRERLEAAGIDATTATTEASADDVDDLRAALGLERVHLLGVSYGTRLALEVLRRHPEGIGVAILDGVVPPTASTGGEALSARAAAALERLDEACAASPTCRATLPDLSDALDRATARLDAQPAVVNVDGAGDGAPRTVRLTGRDLVAGVLLGLYRADLIGSLPQAIAAVAEGSDEPLQAFAGLALPRLARSSEGMAASVACADEPAEDQASFAAAVAEDPALSTFLLLSDLLAACGAWTGDAGPAPGRAEPVTWDGPALLLSGGLDPVTPATLADEAVAHLDAGVAVTFPSMGHGVLFGSTCARELVVGFLDDPAGPLDNPCGTGPQDPFA